MSFENIPSDSPFLSSVSESLNVSSEVSSSASKSSSLGNLDTESYLNHARSALNTQNLMVTSEGLSGFARTELNASSLQMLRQCGGAHSKEWSDFKKSQIVGASPELAQALTDSFNDVEALEENVQQGAAKQHAMMSYKATGLMNVSKMMEECSVDIAHYRKQVADANRQNTDPQMRREIGMKATRNLEEAYLKLATLYLLCVGLFDEGYNTEGACKSICSHEEGQVHQRKFEEFQAKLPGTDVNELIKRGQGFKLEEGEQEHTTMEHHMGSALENAAMYKGHFHHKVHDPKSAEDLQKAAIATSKYSERTLSADYAVMQEMATKNPSLKKDAIFSGLFAKLKALLFKSSEMEKVKRGVTLNQSTSYTLLMQALSSHLTRNQQEAIAPKVKEIIETTGREGSLGQLLFEESITAQDKHLALMTALVDAGLVGIPEDPNNFEPSMDAHGFVVSNNPEVDIILKAVVGTRSYLLTETEASKIKGMQKESMAITMQAHNLKSVESLHAFNKEVQAVTTAVYQRAVQSKLIATPRTGSAEKLSLNYQWQCATLLEESL